jgi:hypothetical protein
MIGEAVDYAEKRTMNRVQSPGRHVLPCAGHALHPPVTGEVSSLSGEVDVIRIMTGRKQR